MPGAEESASSITTASFGSISPIAWSSASGCTGVVPASARALACERLALGGDRVGRGLEPRRARRRARRWTCARATAAVMSGSVAFGSPRMRDLRRIVLAELPGIDVEMDQRDAGRHRIDVGRQRQVNRSPPTENSTSY